MKNYFNPSEFSCRCGCGTNHTKPNLLSMLNAAREETGIPLVLTSGTRCEVNNTTSGGAPDSAHLSGWAADIRCRASQTRMKVLIALIHAGFTRIGISRTFIHADCDPDKPPLVAWLY